MNRRQADKDPMRFGHTELPQEQEAALRKAVIFEWITIVYYAFASALIYLVLGNSQAMKANWVETMLAILPPIAFLIATRIIRLRPTGSHPYGFHRAVGIAHLVAASALAGMGIYLFIESGIGLLAAEHPTVGGIEFFGHVIWLGWPMIGVLALIIPVPIYLGRVKLKLARTLHDKILYADSYMNKADWMTNVGAAVGVLGIGLGLWWLDAVAAMLIALDIVHDGIRNLRAAVAGLIDTRARTYDDAEPDPLSDQIDRYLEGLDWVRDARSRVRDEGHVYHVESFVVPMGDGTITIEHLEQARQACIDMDWKVQDLVIIPVIELPDELLPRPGRLA